MLFCAGILKSKGGDATRKRRRDFTSSPSMVAFKVLMPTSSVNPWAQASRSASVPPKNGKDSTFEHSTLMIGKNKGVSDGTVHWRVTGFPVAMPARKNTGRD